ncbi:MAG TPA: hypothetical protein PLK99_00045 [Burkholderiales bacterium]|nr:hypothetical protein [Burkholderiales bacterium]
MAYTYGPGGARSALNITAKTLIKAGPATLFKLVIITAPTVAGGIYDSATTAGTSASNLINPISTGPSTLISLDWPCQNGIVIDPGTGGVMSVSYT